MGYFKCFLGYYLFKKRGPTCGPAAVGTKIPWRPKAATHAGDRRPEIAWRPKQPQYLMLWFPLGVLFLS